MKKLLLCIVLLSPFFSFSQVDFFRPQTIKPDYPGVDELKDATLHVMIKDFCDDSKPFKKMLQDYWKISKISFDYDSTFDDRYDHKKPNPCKEGEWYMYLERNVTTTQNTHSTTTTINIGKNISPQGKVPSIANAITIPLLPIPEDGVCIPWSLIFLQSLDVSKCFLNLSNEYYLKNDIQILDQLISKELTLKKNDCDDKKAILADTLYIPDYVFLVSSKCGKDFEFADHKEYMGGYESAYVILTNDEMIKLFKAGKPFYYMLFAASDNFKYHFVIEGISGKVMAINKFGGYNLNSAEMGRYYDQLNNKRKPCK